MYLDSRRSFFDFSFISKTFISDSPSFVNEFTYCICFLLNALEKVQNSSGNINKEYLLLSRSLALGLALQKPRTSATEANTSGKPEAGASETARKTLQEPRQEAAY